MKLRLVVVALSLVCLVAVVPQSAGANLNLTLDRKHAKSLTTRAMKQRFASYRSGSKKRVHCSGKSSPIYCTAGWRNGGSSFFGYITVQAYGNAAGTGVPAKYDYTWGVHYSVGRAAISCVRQSHSQSACVNKSYDDYVYFPNTTS